MTDLRKAAEMALEALQHANDVAFYERCVEDCYTDDINALRQALAQEVTREVTGDVDNSAHKAENVHRNVDKVYMSEKHVHKSDKSIHEREWVGLTEDEFEKAMHGSVEGSNMLPYQFARAIEAKLKEKNGG